MATLIPALGSCVRRMQTGEKRLADRLEQKLEDDYLCWYDVPIGRANLHPDFIVLHPRRGLLILEVKDWKIDSLAEVDKLQVSLRTPTGVKRVANPLEQARQYAHEVVRVLGSDPQLKAAEGAHAGGLLFPWAYGVVLPGITRRQFEDAALEEVLEPHRVICADEMTEAEDAERFQKRLWDMFSVRFQSALSLPQIDRIRWHLFPEIRIPQPQLPLFNETPDLMKVMDLQQEQLARSLGEGHRVIHGVAGSGKTLILGYRAEYLAKACAKPILVLCYNKSLAKRLASVIQAKGLGAKVNVRHFHKWCRDQLVAFHAALPPDNKDHDAWSESLVQAVISAVDKGLVPRAQYDAVLIDEGHDFHPHWLKLVVQMVDPRSNSLLVLYDDAQSIYSDGGRPKFSFKSVGIQAAGRTTILRVNYRNTQEILELARGAAAGLLQGKESDEDGVPTLAPQSAGRAGPAPVLLKLPSTRDEAHEIVERLKFGNGAGLRWRDMAVICRYRKLSDDILSLAKKAGIPASTQEEATFADTENTVKFLTMHSCKGLEFPWVAIPGTRLMSKDGRVSDEDAKLLYVAMTRATHQLVVFQ